jgi:hypothetical protein
MQRILREAWRTERESRHSKRPVEASHHPGSDTAKTNEAHLAALGRGRLTADENGGIEITCNVDLQTGDSHFRQLSHKRQRYLDHKVRDRESMYA